MHNLEIVYSLQLGFEMPPVAYRMGSQTLTCKRETVAAMALGQWWELSCSPLAAEKQRRDFSQQTSSVSCLKGCLLYLSLHGVCPVSVLAFEREKENKHLLLSVLHVTLLLGHLCSYKEERYFVLLLSLVSAFASSAL